MLTANDIMKIDVVTVSPDTTVEQLGRLFIEKDISGAPVVDSAGRLIGIVTENDLISRNKRLHIPTFLRLFDAFIPLEGGSSLDEEVKKISATSVEDICSKEVISVKKDATIEEMATIMTENKVHLLPVIENSKLLGIVGKREIIKGIAG